MEQNSAVQSRPARSKAELFSHGGTWPQSCSTAMLYHNSAVLNQINLLLHLIPNWGILLVLNWHHDHQLTVARHSRDGRWGKMFLYLQRGKEAVFYFLSRMAFLETKWAWSFILALWYVNKSLQELQILPVSQLLWPKISPNSGALFPLIHEYLGDSPRSSQYPRAYLRGLFQAVTI